MKFIKSILKFLLILIIVTTIVFFILDTKSFYSWCKKYDLQMFNTHNISDEDVENLDEFKINGLGKGITSMKEIELEFMEENNIEKIDQENFATGYASWLQLQSSAFEITQYYKLSILIGVIITLGYILIKKLIIFLKEKNTN